MILEESGCFWRNVDDSGGILWFQILLEPKLI